MGNLLWQEHKMMRDRDAVSEDDSQKKGSNHIAEGFIMAYLRVHAFFV